MKQSFSSSSTKQLDDPDNSTDILQRYSIVKEVFLKFNAPHVSSTPVERLFLFGSIIQGGRRGSFSDQNFEKLILIKAKM